MQSRVTRISALLVFPRDWFNIQPKNQAVKPCSRVLLSPTVHVHNVARIPANFRWKLFIIASSLLFRVVHGFLLQFFLHFNDNFVSLYP